MPKEHSFWAAKQGIIVNAILAYAPEWVIALFILNMWFERKMLACKHMESQPKTTKNLLCTAATVGESRGGLSILWLNVIGFTVMV